MSATEEERTFSSVFVSEGLSPPPSSRSGEFSTVRQVSNNSNGSGSASSVVGGNSPLIDYRLGRDEQGLQQVELTFSLKDCQMEAG